MIFHSRLFEVILRFQVNYSRKANFYDA